MFRGSSQGQLTRRTGRRPLCPRAPPRPGAARLPRSRALGPGRGDSAISERTLCRSRTQPLPSRGEAARLAPARLSTGSRPGSHRTEKRENQIAAALSRTAASDSGVSATLQKQHTPSPPRRVAQSGQRQAPRLPGQGRARPLSPAEGEPGRPTETEGSGRDGAGPHRSPPPWTRPPALPAAAPGIGLKADVQFNCKKGPWGVREGTSSETFNTGQLKFDPPCRRTSQSNNTMDCLKVILLNIFSSRFHCNKAMKGLPTFRTNTN